MPTLRLVDGLPLIVGGELATADACCCGGGPCETDEDCTGGQNCCNGTCCDCQYQTYTIGPGWFVPENETDLQTLAANAGWTVVFTYPDYFGGYCPDEPDPDGDGQRLCPGPFTDECGQTWTLATFTSVDPVCEFCGTESIAQQGYGIGGNYFPSVFGGTPCDQLTLGNTGTYTIDKLCNLFP